MKFVLYFVCYFVVQQGSCKYVNSPKRVTVPQPGVLVIGAGVSGLSSARYLKDAGIPFTVLEATRYVGGTWRYEPRVGTDEDGLPVRSSMYKHLKTNLPKVAMQIPGFPFPDDYPEYPTGFAYYEYLKSYANHFDLYKHIKFQHEVLNVSRVNGNWLVKYRNVSTDERFEDTFDYVMVGVGHYSVPKKPILPGEDKFKGRIIHSHDYREPEPYKDKRVLIVGAGSSAMDIGVDVAEVSKALVHSHHSSANFQTPFPKHWVTKPDIKEFTEDGVVFKDGSYEDIDDVIYCTGYQYYYPFMDESCALKISPGYVIPLYRHMVNIYEPTMLLIGFISKSCVVITIDAQARYAAALISGKFKLPSQKEMMAAWQHRADEIQAKNLTLKYIHVSTETDGFYEKMAAESGIKPVPPVLYDVCKLNVEARDENLYTYRNYVYIVHDDRNFTRVYNDPTITTVRPIGLAP